MKQLLALLTLVVVTAVAAPPPSLTGTWTLVSIRNIAADGSVALPYGEHPQGTLIFDADGRYAVLIFRADRARFASGDKNRGTSEENEAYVRGTNSHFGRYSVEPGMLIFHIDHASFPNWEGTEQRRAFTLENDVLRYTVRTTTSGGSEIAEVTWKRVAGSYTVAAVPAPYDFFTGNIQAICGPSNLGCTDITSPTLHAPCAKRDDAWTAAPAVKFGALVHLPALAGPGATHKLIAHELDHIKDIHRDAERYARELSQRRFESFESCHAAALREEATFSSRVAQFAKQSVAVRR
jgi:hypothetical protein